MGLIENSSFALPSADTIRLDLNERPTWYLSSYAPSKDSPAQLIDGKDISPEEARVMAYRLRAEGAPQAYVRSWYFPTITLAKADRALGGGMEQIDERSFITNQKYTR